MEAEPFTSFLYTSAPPPFATVQVPVILLDLIADLICGEVKQQVLLVQPDNLHALRHLQIRLKQADEITRLHRLHISTHPSANLLKASHQHTVLRELLHHLLLLLFELLAIQRHAALHFVHVDYVHPVLELHRVALIPVV